MKATVFKCKVARMSGDRPMLFLPDRTKVKNVPFGPTTVIVDGVALEANFVKIALNVVRDANGVNVLPAIVTRWFGPTAGQRGTKFMVTFEPTDAGLVMRADEVA